MTIFWGVVGYAIFVSHDGTIISHPNKEYIGKNIRENPILLKYSDYIFSGKSFIGKDKDFYKDKSESLVFIEPISLGDSQYPWSIIGVAKIDEIFASLKIIQDIMFFSGLIITILVLITIYYTLNTLYKKIGVPKKLLNFLGYS